MSSLISYGTGTAPDEADEPATITNNGFWPDIDPANFRVVERLDSSVTAERISHSLQISISEVNSQLGAWQARQGAEGHESHEAVPAPSWAIGDHYKTLYLRAVYATARATLLERYRDHSATPAGDAAGQAKVEAADDYRRDARWAVSDIEGRTRTTVELI